MTADIGDLGRNFKPSITKLYPNLSAILDGRVSGSVTEWPLIRNELDSLLKSYQESTDIIHKLVHLKLLKEKIEDRSQWNPYRDKHVEYYEKEKKGAWNNAKNFLKLVGRFDFKGLLDG